MPRSPRQARDVIESIITGSQLNKIYIALLVASYQVHEFLKQSGQTVVDYTYKCNINAK